MQISDYALLEAPQLPKLPRLIFLDTNIVQNLQTFGELFYDNSLSSESEAKIAKLGERGSADIFALADFMALGHRGGWPLTVSSRTVEELKATQRRKRMDLINWGMEWETYYRYNLQESPTQSESNSYVDLDHFTFTQRNRLREWLRVLPQESDRQLIIDALELGCDIFLTMDYKTIWRHRADIGKLGIKVMRPIELLDYIGPWIGLLR